MKITNRKHNDKKRYSFDKPSEGVKNVRLIRVSKLTTEETEEKRKRIEIELKSRFKDYEVRGYAVEPSLEEYSLLLDELLKRPTYLWEYEEDTLSLVVPEEEIPEEVIEYEIFEEEDDLLEFAEEIRFTKDLRRFLRKRPHLSLAGLSIEMERNRQYLKTIRDGNSTVGKNSIDVIREVLKDYGFNK